MTPRAEDGREGLTNACTEVADGAFSKWKHYWPQLGDANRYVAMMRVLKSIVEIAFEIEGRGCVVCPGLLYEDNPAVRIGDHIDLLRPDGSEIRTSIRGIEMIRTTERKGIPLLLPCDIHKNDVPSGTVLMIYEGSPRDTEPTRSCFAIGDTVRAITNHRNQYMQSGVISETSWNNPNQIWHYAIRLSDHSNSAKFTATDLELQEKAT